MRRSNPVALRSSSPDSRDMRELFFGLLLWKLYQLKRLLRKHNQIRISHWSTVSCVHARGAFGTILIIPAAWKNLENKGLSSLRKLLRNCLWEEEERRYSTPPPRKTFLLDGSVTIDAKTTVHCSPYSSVPSGFGTIFKSPRRLSECRSNALLRGF